jgi:hypothetical protein
MTDPKEEPTKEVEAEKADDEKKSEVEDKAKPDEKVESDDKKEADEKEKGDGDKKEEPKEDDAVASKSKTTKKRKKEDKEEADDKAKGDDDDKEEVASEAKKPKKEDKEKEDEMETDEKKGDDDDKEGEEPKEDSKAKTSKKVKKDKPETAAAKSDRPQREQRVRKTANVFEPDNFLGANKTLQVVAGRGTKLSEIAAIKATIDKLSMNSSDLMLAHRLLYTRQGKPAKKEIKKNLLDFCGFLPKKAEGQDKEELEALEEEAEVCMSMAGYLRRAFRVHGEFIPAWQSRQSFSRVFIHFFILFLIPRPK